MSDAINLKIFEGTCTDPKLRVYKRRWFILLIYLLGAISMQAQWLQFSIISNVMTRFYSVDSAMVDMTSLLFNVGYLVFALPVSWAMNKINMRHTVLLGVLFSATGAWVKVLAANPNRFLYGFAGQLLVSVSNVFLISLPAKISSQWFPNNEISTACCIGQLGVQIGLACSFFLSPLMVRNSEDARTVSTDLMTMFVAVASVNTAVLTLAVFCFEDGPPVPPSLSQALAISSADAEPPSFLRPLTRLATKPSYAMMFISSGLNNAMFISFSALFNQIFISYFPESSAAGPIGTTMTVAGIVATFVYGILLDKTKMYKETIVTVYYLSALAMAVMGWALESGRVSMVYVAAAALGFFLSGFTPVSYEVAVEATYPEPEVTTATILTAMNLGLGLALTPLISYLLGSFPSLWAVMACSMTLAVGATAMVPIKLKPRRQNAQSRRTYSRQNTMAVGEMEKMNSL